MKIWKSPLKAVHSKLLAGVLLSSNQKFLADGLALTVQKKIILGADVKGEYIATDGWLETSDQSLFDFLAHYQAKGIQYTICTDISKDGMLQGPSFDLYQKILSETQVKLIASGGISQFDELPRLAEMGCEGTIIGKAIYENRISLKELEQFILSNN